MKNKKNRGEKKMMQKASLETIEQVRQILQSYDFALTLRQIYYQLVVKQIIPNQEKQYKRLSWLCVKGRDEGMLPEDSFTDRLRVMDKPSSWLDLSDFMVSVKSSYRKDSWPNQHDYVEIWLEKDALRSVISEITHRYDVPLMVVRGQVSRTAIYESYMRFKEKIDEEKDCYLYYAGDFDSSGIPIYESLVERLKEYGEAGESINFERIALTPLQIDKYNLPSDLTNKKDSNSKKFVLKYGDNATELDSLPPDVLKSVVKDCIERHIDQSILGLVQKIEVEEQRSLEEIISQANHPSLKGCGLAP